MQKTNQTTPAQRGVGRPKLKLEHRFFQLKLTQTDLVLPVSGADIVAHFGGSLERFMAEVSQFIQNKISQTNATETNQTAA